MLSLIHIFRKGEREADKGGGAQGRAGESLSGHLQVHIGYLGGQFLFFQLRLKYHADDRTGSLLPFLAHHLDVYKRQIIDGELRFDIT